MTRLDNLITYTSVFKLTIEVRIPLFMRVLLVLSSVSKTFWSYWKILELINRKVLPPLGLVTVAIFCPKNGSLSWWIATSAHSYRSRVEWADVCIFNFMIVQKQDLMNNKSGSEAASRIRCRWCWSLSNLCAWWSNVPRGQIIWFWMKENYAANCWG